MSETIVKNNVSDNESKKDKNFPKSKSSLSSYTNEEINTLKGIFSLYETDGHITPNELEALLSQISRTNDDDDDDDDEHDANENDSEKTKDLSNSSSKEQERNENDPLDARVSFSRFLRVLETRRPRDSLPNVGPDPRAVQFLHVLEKYRISCEAEGKYLEAQRANTQLRTLRGYEETRQQNAVRAQFLHRQMKVHRAHEEQYREFEQRWKSFLENFDETCREFVRTLQRRQARKLAEFQETLRQEMLSRPPKWSRELLEWRKRQHILARQKNYAEAQKIKAISDALEDEERGSINAGYAGSLARKEANLRQLQVAEVNALLKRIDVRRKEHLKQKELDCKRLLQRNRNVLVSLESKQAIECEKLFQDIKNNMIKELKSVKIKQDKNTRPKQKPRKKKISTNKKVVNE